MSQVNIFNTVKQLPPDALFDIKKRLSQDTRSVKVDLGIGAYRDNSGKPWVLPSVRSAEAQLQKDPNYNHEYLPIAGLPSFTSGAARTIFGDDYDEKRVISVQSISGTGALHIAAKFIEKFLPNRTVYLSNPTWANHKAIFEGQRLITAQYPYWNANTKSLELDGFLDTIKTAQEGSIFVLHACAHNPTGLDPNQEQWNHILDSIVQKNHVVLFDSAYQGFATGDLNRDAYAVRLGLNKLEKVAPVIVCQSFAKNVGMYGERVGCFHLVLPQSDNITQVKPAVASQLAAIVRSEVSNPPAYGAKIVSTILNSPELTKQWHEDMITMSSRIKQMRYQLRDHLVELETPGNWDHIVGQCGMFSFTALTPQMVQRLEQNHAVYMTSSGRASIAGLNEGNVLYVAKAIDEVVRHFTANNNSKL